MEKEYHIRKMVKLIMREIGLMVKVKATEKVFIKVEIII